jgi:glutamyl-tRNA reductase
MSMRIHIWGTDFRRGTAELRRKLYLAPEMRQAMLSRVVQSGFTDLVYLATCNRIEFYTTAKDPFCDTRPQWLELLKHFDLGEEAFYQGYHLEGKAAMRHLLRVASSLESLVVGEPQILGQLKDALNWSKENGLPVDPSLERSFQLAFETAKRVRTETTICEKPVSVATLGMQYLQAHEQLFPLKQSVVIGRSPMNVVAIQWLLKNRPGHPILWVNRTVETLKAYPEAAHCELMSLSDFLQKPRSFSHFFTATASLEPLFHTNFFKRAALEGRALAFDFAEPSDIGDLGESCPEVTVIKLQDLQEEARANAASRAMGVAAAQAIVENSLKNYCMQQKQAPLLRDFNAVEPTYLEELKKAFVDIERDFPPEVQAKIKRWAESLVKRNLHVSREHLRAVLKKVTDPSEENASFHIY